jgi:hypothetical protein
MTSVKTVATSARDVMMVIDLRAVPAGFLVLFIRTTPACSELLAFLLDLLPSSARNGNAEQRGQRGMKKTVIRQMLRGIALLT